ncbi:helix-turn-helix transcriptional regulator [bacterium]|nr:helix-turn-helix transcriptional regulator [bacterium]
MSNREFNSIICKRITNLRKSKNLTVEKLAYQSGISKGGLSEIERGKKSPMPLTILKICTGLGITIKDFFDYEEINKFQNKL